MRLIDADALLEKVQYIGEKCTVDNPFADMYAVVLEEDIENAPTVEFVTGVDFSNVKDTSVTLADLCEECTLDGFYTVNREVEE